MKKIILPLILLPIALAPVRADVIFNETFNYADGALTNVAAGIWIKHSGNATGSDSLVANHKLQVGVARQDDVHRDFPAAYTATQTNVYASFLINCTNLPTTTNYFAHFYVNSTTFHGRLWNMPGSLPNTWRLGLTSLSTTLGLIKIFPMDLATNVDYQVVLAWNPVANFTSTNWVNPISVSDPYIFNNDAVSSPAASTAFGFRQPGSFNGPNSFNIGSLVVATTFDEAATNVLSTNAVAPVIAYNPSPANKTNFVGDTITYSAVAAGQGLASMTYQWTRDGVNVANDNGNSNVLSKAGATVADTGNYRLIATTPFGLSATSSPAFLWVTNAPVPPIVIPATNRTVSVSFHQTTALHVDASGPPPITFAWYYNNGLTGPNTSGDGTDTLTITDVTSTNDTAGAYYCVASNPYGSTTSGVFTVTAVAPPAVSIAYLRTLVDANFNATNPASPAQVPTSPRWQVTGTVTTETNLTTGNTSSYYLQDSTAGINIFVTSGQTFRPAIGDVITFVGWLSSFNSTLELEADANDPSTSFTVLSNNVAGLPSARVIPFDITNNTALCEGSLEGRIVMLTNVYFGTNAGTTISTSANQTVVVTNGAGETFNVFFSFQDLDTAGQTLPDFAWSVIGPFTQNQNNTAVPRNGGYSVTVTRFADIITTPPPAVSASIAKGGSKTLSWAAVPYNYSYSVLSSPAVGGPYVVQNDFQAAMLGVGEVPPTTSTATGFGTVVLSPDQTSITVNMRFGGLTVPATAAHIHGPAGAGTNAPVLFPFSGVPAATSGSIPEQTFAITPTQIGYLQSGLLYMNVHNANYPGGEIRAQILLTPSSGLTFPNASGSYVDKNDGGPGKLYRVSSP